MKKFKHLSQASVGDLLHWEGNLYLIKGVTFDADMAILTLEQGQVITMPVTTGVTIYRLRKKVKSS
ncbi:hypothetical protein WG906_17225 [Pedobacter sp. P351]|uniref:hypothetical protein n=1 Tax=Pedobacter superstes TaxID=3133441 RepID=UPI0030A9823E